MFFFHFVIMCQRGIKKIANIFAFGRFSAWARIYNRFVFFTLDVLDVGVLEGRRCRGNCFLEGGGGGGPAVIWWA